MDTDALILVSVDDHLVEPPTLFDAHIPARHRDRAPKIVHTDIGDDVWMFEGEAVPYMGLNAVAGRPREEYGIEPMAYDEMRRGGWDGHGGRRAPGGGAGPGADGVRRDAPRVLGRARAGEGHERRRCAGVAQLPVVP